MINKSFIWIASYFARLPYHIATMLLFLFIHLTVNGQENLLTNHFPTHQARVLEAEKLMLKINENQFQKDLQMLANIPEQDKDLFFEYIQEKRIQDYILFQKYVASGTLNETNFKTYYAFILNTYSEEFRIFNTIKGNLLQLKKQRNNLRQAANGSCINIGFEEGTLDGWEGSVANRNPLDTPVGLQAGMLQHCIMTPDRKDPLIPDLPVVAPGSNYSLRLGNTVAGGQIAKIKQTFRVDSSNLIFLFRYAVVFENPDNAMGHDGDGSPHFKANVYDASGNLVECLEYAVRIEDSSDSYQRVCVGVPSNNLRWDDLVRYNENKGCNDNYQATNIKPFPTSGDCNVSMEIYYKSWTTVSIPLFEYYGQNVTIEFVAADCAPAGHLGYAYVDAECLPLNGELRQKICSGQQTKTLHGPDGFKSYLWKNDKGEIIENAHERTINVARAGKYELLLEPFIKTSFLCPHTLTYHLSESCFPFPKKDTLCESEKGSKKAEGVKLETFNTLITENKIWGEVTSWHLAIPATILNQITAPIEFTDSIHVYALTRNDYRQDTILLKLYTSPLPEISFINQDTLCQGSQAFVFKNFLPPGGIFTGDHTTPEGIFFPTDTGSFKILYKSANGRGCADSVFQYVKVQAPTWVNAGNDTSICEDQKTINLKATSNHLLPLTWIAGTGSSGIMTQYNQFEATYTLSPADLEKENISFFLSSTESPGCPISRDTIKFLFEKKPNFSFLLQDSLCQLDSMVNISAQANNFSALHWIKLPQYDSVGDQPTLYIPIEKSEKSQGKIQLKLIASSLGNCPAFMDSTIISVLHHPVFFLQNDSICPGEKIKLSPSILNNSWVEENYLKYKWYKDGELLPENSKELIADTGGNYKLEVTNKYCVGNDSAFIYQLPSPHVQIDSSVNYCNNDSIEISPITKNTKLLYRIHLQTEPAIDITKIEEEGIYILEVTNEYGCKKEETFQVTFSCGPAVFLPKAFSPNDDGINDVFTIFSSHIGLFEMKIFNRWGEVIFISNDETATWDGKYQGEFMPPGVYPWILTYEGDTEKYKGPFKKEGSVLLIK